MIVYNDLNMLNYYFYGFMFIENFFKVLILLITDMTSSDNATLKTTQSSELDNRVHFVAKHLQNAATSYNLNEKKF